MAVALTVLNRNKFGAGLRARVELVFSGSYPAGGEAVNFAAAVGFTNRPPSSVLYESQKGIKYEYDRANKKTLVRRNGNGVPDVVVTGGQAAGSALQILPDSAAGVLGKTVATSRTIPGATFGLTAIPAAEVELPAATYPADVTGDKIIANVGWDVLPGLPS